MALAARQSRAAHVTSCKNSKVLAAAASAAAEAFAAAADFSDGNLGPDFSAAGPDNRNNNNNNGKNNNSGGGNGGGGSNGGGGNGNGNGNRNGNSNGPGAGGHNLGCSAHVRFFLPEQANL